MAKTLYGIVSATGHLNSPDAMYCRNSGRRLAPTAARRTVQERPPIGVVVFDDGASFSIDDDVVLGRDPTGPGHRDSDVRAIDDPTMGVSRNHLLLRMVGWNVEAVDLGTTNGTFVRGHDGGWQRLMPGLGRVIASNSELRIGSRTMKLHLTT